MFDKMIPAVFLWKRSNFSSDEHVSLCLGALGLVLYALHTKYGV